MFFLYFQITGVWYVIESLQHKTDEKLYHGEKLEDPSCPYIYLTYFENDSVLKLYLEESDGNIEFRLKINDKTYPGLWMSSGGQNGKNIEKKNNQLIFFSVNIFIFMSTYYIQAQNVASL